MFQVHIFRRECGAGANIVCTCAVAVRSGDDVVVIDRCGADANSTQDYITIHMYNNGDFTKGTAVHQIDDGHGYMVKITYT